MNPDQTKYANEQPTAATSSSVLLATEAVKSVETAAGGYVFAP